MTKKESEFLMDAWRIANEKIGQLDGWTIGDIEAGKHPEYKNALEYMSDKGKWEGVKDILIAIDNRFPFSKNKI